MRIVIVQKRFSKSDLLFYLHLHETTEITKKNLTKNTQRKFPLILKFLPFIPRETKIQRHFAAHCALGEAEGSSNQDLRKIIYESFKTSPGQQNQKIFVVSIQHTLRHSTEC